MDQDLKELICKELLVESGDAKSYSPLALAFIGDGVFDLVIRTMVVARANAPAQSLHEKTSRIVKASSQAALLKAIWGELSEEEQIYCRRGRNAKPHTMAKNATMHDYRAATGFEALMGFLYLNGQMERLLKLVHTGLLKTGYFKEGKS